MKRKGCMGFFFFLVVQGIMAQEHSWVYFTDKENVLEAITNPNSILTARALARKAKFNILIDVRDVPVNEGYITQLKSQSGIAVKAKSKWFNNAHVLGTLAAIENLRSLGFVQQIVYANKSLNSKQGVSSNADKVPDNHRDKNRGVLADYNYGSTEDQVKQLHANALHEADFTGEGILIAVMDGGFPNVDQLGAFQRLRSNNNLLGGYDFVDRNGDIFRSSGDGHGTNVLSDMAGFVQDQFVGTAPDAGYILFRTEDVASETPVEESYWVEAAERADSLGVDLINTSLGYSTFDNPAFNYAPSDMDGQTTFISKGANIATEKGILVVVSAGNSGTSSVWNIISAPGDANVFTVGAVNAVGNFASFSSRGPNANGIVKPDGMAMGVNTAVITVNNTIGTSNGTSFASPVLAGAIASLWQAFPDKSNLGIMQIVRESSSHFSNPNPELGFGIPDFQLALNASNAPELPEPPVVPEVPVDPELPSIPEEDIVLFPNPGNSIIAIRFSNGSAQQFVTIFDIYGKKVLQKQFANGNNEIAVEQLSNAMYIIHLETPEGIKRFKFIKN